MSGTSFSVLGDWAFCISALSKQAGVLLTRLRNGPPTMPNSGQLKTRYGIAWTPLAMVEPYESHTMSARSLVARNALAASVSSPTWLAVGELELWLVSRV